MSHGDTKSLAGLYLADKAMAAVWHHNLLMGPRSQTLFGIANQNENGEYNFDWE
jgi:hypothetical protein